MFCEGTVRVLYPFWGGGGLKEKPKGNQSEAGLRDFDVSICLVGPGKGETPAARNRN